MRLPPLAMLDLAGRTTHEAPLRDAEQRRREPEAHQQRRGEGGR